MKLRRRSPNPTWCPAIPVRELSRWIGAWAIAMVTLACCWNGAQGQETESVPVDYRRQIQPLLARNCYACHGPDEDAREADLRLDVESDAKIQAIVPGDSNASLLVERVFSADEGEIMPPPQSGHELSDAEKAVLRQWIDEGATWQKHWAFEPIDPPPLPASDPDWGNNAIDRFVLERMRQQRLAPSAPAEKSTLLRRVSLDLIGLPPTPEQVAAFINDPRPDAFEKAVDELLASRHYGEQMAASWLDVARYADTNGYQNDFVRTMWPWRDWVVDAFNENLPYDQFIVQQIAGDMLPSATLPQQIASGFNRNNRSNTEGGSIPEEWRIENCVDRVETTSAAFLGLTMGCCRCHDHKYDPISQKEFYEFFAFFNNVDEEGVYQEARGNVGPQVTVPTPEQTARLDELSKEIVELERQLATRAEQQAPLEELVAAWRKPVEPNAPAELPAPVFSLGEIGGQEPRGSGPAGPSFTLTGQQDAAGKVDPAPLELDYNVPFSWSVWVQGDSRGAIFGRMDEDQAYRGVDGLILEDGRLKVHLIHSWTDNAIAVTTALPLPANRWTALAVTYDGSATAAGLKVYFDGHPAEVKVEVDSLSQTIVPNVPFRIGQRSKTASFKGEISKFCLFDRELTPANVQGLLQKSVVDHYDSLSKANAPASEWDPIASYLRRMENRPGEEALVRLRAERDKLAAEQPTTMVMKERPGAYRETFLLKRGQYDQPDTTVALMPAIPSALPPLSEDQPRNRLGLARWMVDPRNPLVARVAVNRAWIKFFGRGLVPSADNFGLQGTPPTHPQLLDWLADDFRQHGWNLKRLHKQIVMSATYQQSSAFSEELLQRDPENQWLARGPRHRLSAEQIRDQALFVAGLLNPTIGGPSVFPYQPEGLWEELAGGANNGPYKLSTGDDLYRRSLYTYRKRTVSHPTLATFDAPTWEVCQVKRATTNTPLQSLALLNDVTYVEASRKLAEQMLGSKSSGPRTDPPAAITFGFALATQRQPTDNELNTLTAGYNDYLAFYREHPDEAQQLLATGQAPVNDALPPDQLAAMTSVAAILLNLDEVISKH